MNRAGFKRVWYLNNFSIIDYCLEAMRKMLVNTKWIRDKKKEKKNGMKEKLLSSEIRIELLGIIMVGNEKVKKERKILRKKVSFSWIRQK